MQDALGCIMVCNMFHVLLYESSSLHLLLGKTVLYILVVTLAIVIAAMQVCALAIQAGLLCLVFHSQNQNNKLLGGLLFQIFILYYLAVLSVLLP